MKNIFIIFLLSGCATATVVNPLSVSDDSQKVDCDKDPYVRICVQDGLGDCDRFCPTNAQRKQEQEWLNEK